MKRWVGWLVYSRQDAKRNAEYIQWMLAEAAEHDLDLRLVHREDIYVGIRGGVPSVWLSDGLVSAPDFVIVRLIDPVLTTQLEQLGIKAFNSAHVARICNNKALTHQYLSQFSIPMLDTLFSNTAYLAEGPASYPFPFVLKTVMGRGGQDVRLIQTQADLKQFIERYPTTEVIVQGLGPVPGTDIRVYVIGKQIIAAVIRKSSTEDFRANLSLGGTVSLFTLTELQEALVRRIIAAFDFGLVGIDFLLDKNGGLLFNEIEDVVGSRGLSRVAPHLNLVQQYLLHIQTRLETDRK